MSWLRRRDGGPEAVAPAPIETAPPALEGAAPGVASLLQDLADDRSLAILDLGPASPASLAIYGRFARWVRFADLLGIAGWPDGRPRSPAELVSALPPPERPYDLVFGWDILDRLFAEDRGRLVEWLDGLVAPAAQLHLVVRASDETVMRPLRFEIIETGRIRIETVSSSPLPPSRLLPADVTRLLAPMRVQHAYNLKSGLREYVARNG